MTRRRKIGRKTFEKKDETTKDENSMNEDIVKLIIGGVFGAAIALPNATDREAVKYYTELKQFTEKRKMSLGDILISKWIVQDIIVDNTLREAIQMYIYGSNKGSSFLCIAILESKLREKYKSEAFAYLIKQAKEDKLISESDYYFLNALRMDRNYLAHNILNDFTENDAQITIKLVIKILNKLYDNLPK